MIEHDEFTCAVCGERRSVLDAIIDLSPAVCADCYVLDEDWPDRTSPRPDERRRMPDPAAVAELTEVLDLMANFESNEQRARYLLSCNWMEKWGAAAAARITASLAASRAKS
jgi:hypothetical protein